MKSTRNTRQFQRSGTMVQVRMHGFKRTEEQFGIPQDFEMAAGFYDASDSWNQTLIKTMSNMRLCCHFFS